MSEKRARKAAKRKRQLEAKRKKRQRDSLSLYKTFRVESESSEEFLAIVQGPELDPAVWPEAIREDMSDFVLGLRAEGEAVIVRTKPDGNIRIIALSIIIDFIRESADSWRQDWIQISGVHFDEARIKHWRELTRQVLRDKA